jgi:hypothetical protein
MPGVSMQAKVVLAMQYSFDTLPVHPQPKPLEDFVSYFTRLGVENGLLSRRQLARFLFSSKRSRPEGIADYPPISFGKIPILTSCDMEMLNATTFYYISSLFGRTVSPVPVARFLSGVISKTLRYCQLCIREKPWYILPWRFNILDGCPIHRCRLEDRCPGCGNTLPLLASPLCIGRCSTCGINLAVGTPTRLSSNELVVVERRFNDLTFLLRPIGIQSKNTGMTKRIGEQYTLLRMKNNMLVKDVAKHLGFSDIGVSNLEWGKVKEGSMPFTLYISYADMLGVSLASIVRMAYYGDSSQVDEVQDSFGRRHRIYYNESTTEIVIRRPIKWTDENLLSAIQEVINKLENQGTDVTVQLISSMLHIKYRTLKKYPRSESFIHMFTANKQNILILSYKEKVEQAIADLISMNLPVNGKSISKASGVCWTVLLRWPELRDMISNATGKPFPVNGRDCLTVGVRPRNRIQEREIREDDLIIRIEEAIHMIKELGQSINQPNVCRLLGIGRYTLGHYPRARDLIHQASDEYNARLRMIERISREDELVQRVRKCIDMLLKEGKIPTKKEISRQIGMVIAGMNKYPQVRAIIDGISGEYRRDVDKSKTN